MKSNAQEAMIVLDGVLYAYESMDMVFDLTVARGAFLTVFGPSGAGKTTLLNLIAGFERPSGGDIRLDGRSVIGQGPAQRPVTTLFQEHNLFAHLTVTQNVGLGCDPGLRLDDHQKRQIADALDRVGLADYLDRLPGQLSGGERQRVALARALVRQRAILLLDEPFAALGPAQRADMAALVDSLRIEQDMTVVMVTHQLDELRGIAGDAAFVKDGRIRAVGSAREMLTRPPLPDVLDYLGTVGRA